MLFRSYLLLHDSRTPDTPTDGPRRTLHRTNLRTPRSKDKPRDHCTGHSLRLDIPFTNRPLHRSCSDLRTQHCPATFLIDSLRHTSHYRLPTFLLQCLCNGLHHRVADVALTVFPDRPLNRPHTCLILAFHNRTLHTPGFFPCERLCDGATNDVILIPPGCFRYRTITGLLHVLPNVFPDHSLRFVLLRFKHGLTYRLQSRLGADAAGCVA